LYSYNKLASAVAIYSGTGSRFLKVNQIRCVL